MLVKPIERFSEVLINKDISYKWGGKESSKIWHIQINKLAHYSCILLIVSAKSSLLVEKQKSWAKPGQKSVTFDINQNR